jgi:hypothetical protein
METHVCPRCNIEYPATTEYFHRHSKRKNGLSFYCKGCNNANTQKNYRKRKVNPALIIPPQTQNTNSHFQTKTPLWKRAL